MNDAWNESRFTGIFRDFQRLASRPHDPQVSICAGIVPHLHPHQNGVLHVGGCGWSDEAAANACAGEAVERLFAYPTNQDAAIEASYEDWPLDEPAIAPERWVLFHPQQYATGDFPFQPLTRQTRCPWVCFREVLSGEPQWIPEEFAYLFPRPGCGHRFCPATSTGLAAGKAGQPLVLRALQEVIERDALLGAWWGRYPVEEVQPETAWAAEEALRLQRPNLHWRFFRIHSPFSDHVTLATVEGEDREGFCYSIGSACRESRCASWDKCTLEAVQGRHYVRHLRQQRATHALQPPLQTFEDHALYFSFHRVELERTVLNFARRTSEETVPRKENAVNGARPSQGAAMSANARASNDATASLSPSRLHDEDLPFLCERLKGSSPVLVRNLTPPMLIEQGLDWRVVKVVVPGLQPLHGDDRFAHLGGQLWRPRALKEWGDIPPHPFP
jgi:thiazole/oxazole-forming peptide maturase SagD family component